MIYAKDKTSSDENKSAQKVFCRIRIKGSKKYLQR